MAEYKPNDTVTDASGTTWRRTKGGNWRAENGANKGKLFKDVGGKGDPVAGGSGAAAAPSGPNSQTATPTPTTTPTSTTGPTRAGEQFLAGVKADLQGAVQSGGLSQFLADAEYQRRADAMKGYSPALLDEQLKLYQQYKSGQIDLKSFDDAMQRAQLNAQVTSPQTTANLTDKSSTSDIANTIGDQAKLNTVAGNVLSNPNQANPFGSQTTTIDPITGQPLVTQTLSQANQNVLGGIQGSAVNSSQLLQNLLGNQYNQFVQGAGPQSGYADDELQNAIYSRLTQGFSDQRAREQEQLEQTLANRGIPVGSQAYTNATKDFQTAWNTRDENARNDAVVQATNTALQRQQNNVGALGALNTGVGTLGGVGQSGLYLPQFQGFQATQYNQPNVQDIWSTLFAGQLQREGFANALEQQRISSNATKSLGGGGGGSGYEPKKPSAFGSPPGS